MEMVNVLKNEGTLFVLVHEYKAGYTLYPFTTELSKEEVHSDSFMEILKTLKEINYEPDKGDTLHIEEHEVDHLERMKKSA